MDSIDGAAIYDIMYFTHPPDGVVHSFNFVSYSGTVKLSTLSANESVDDSLVDQFVRDMNCQVRDTR